MDVANGVLKYERRILSAKVKVLAMDQFHKDVDTLSGLLPLKCFYYTCTHICSNFFSIQLLVKINGNNARKLLNRISENSEMNIKVLPLILSPSSVLNSLWSFINSIFHIIVCREGINHILTGINIIPRNVLVQLIDIFVILVDVSNTENKFIIFSLVFLF
jgi:hypothetical protein